MTILPSTPTPPVVSTGIVSGLNTSQIIQAMLQPYLQQENNIKNQQGTLNANVQDYQAVNSDLLALQSAAQALNTPSGWNARQASSSAPAVATVSAADGTPTGSVQFVVQNLAAANSLVSTGSVGATSTIVDSASSFLLSQGGAQLGLATLAAGSSLPLGAHSVKVTQASEAASTTGTVALGSQSSGITVDSSNDTLSVTANGTTYNLTLASSSGSGYSGSDLLAAVNNAITAAGAGGVIQAGYDSAGHLILSTVDQGSSQSLQVTGGTALATLGLSTMSSPTTGVDGIVSVDGTTTTLSTLAAGQAVTLGAPTGSVQATLIGASQQSQVNSSLLSVGSLTATSVSTGSGSLADVVANINAASSGVTASAIQTSNGQYVLQLLSSTTGSAADLSVDMGAFSASGLGALKVASAGTDAAIEIGGAGGYTLTSSTNTFTGLLPGLTVNLVSQSSTPVTVTVNPDASAMATKVQSMVDAANTALADIQKYAGYNAQTKQGGPLMGSPQLASVTNQIESIFASIQGTSTLGNARNVGITLKDGSLSFDQNAFTTAFDANPSQVAAMFTQGGTFSPAAPGYAGQVSLTFAGSGTRPGSYQVVVNQSATQAVDSGATLGSGTVGTGETLTIAMGTNSVDYTTTAGQSLSAVASGINAALAGAGIDLTAELVNSGTQLQLVSAGYGSATAFTVTSSATGAGTTGLGGASAGTPAAFAGTDVAGTINGVAATGSGQFLSAPSDDQTLAGLTLQITQSGISAPTTLGSFTYSPGMAQALTTLSGDMADPATGTISGVIKGLQNESQGLTSQLSFYTNIANTEQQMLLQRFANLEAQLGTLKNQATTLSQQLAQLG